MKIHQKKTPAVARCPHFASGNHLDAEGVSLASGGVEYLTYLPRCLTQGVYDREGGMVLTSK